MTLKYACTALVGTNKTGVVKPDENGYYKLCLGALNFFNSSGIYYDYNSSRHVFEESASFMRRITNGNLYSEREHPEWLEGMSFQDYVRRIKKLDAENLAAHIREIEVVQDGVNERGDPIYLIYGWVKPFGDHGEKLKAALENPDQNVCFSLRALCDDVFVRGVKIRTITDLVTFDWVIEPGISKAHKYNAPGLESFALESRDMDIPVEAIEKCIARNEELQASGFGLENDDLLGLERTLEIVAPRHNRVAKPAAFGNW